MRIAHIQSTPRASIPKDNEIQPRLPPLQNRRLNPSGSGSANRRALGYPQGLSGPFHKYGDVTVFAKWTTKPRLLDICSGSFASEPVTLFCRRRAELYEADVAIWPYKTGLAELVPPNYPI